MANIKTFAEFQNVLASDTKLQQAFKEDPVKASKEINSYTVPDTFIYRVVVVALGSDLLLVIVAVVTLALMGKTSNQEAVLTILTSIASGAIGALAGLLAPSPTGN